MLESSQAFAAAHASADSANFPVVIGQATIIGIAGDSVTLELTADAGLLAAVGSGARVDVSAGRRDGSTVVRSTSLASLTHGAVVYRFLGGVPQAPDTVFLVYALPRVFGAISPREPARLTQRVPSAGAVVAWTAPWASSPRIGLSAAVAGGATTCTIGAPGEACGVTVGITPYSAAAVWGAFQSGPGTGESSEISVTFSRPVTSVTVTIEDPTFDGNAMIAYDAAGHSLGTRGFASSGVPGTNIPSTQTISADGIRRVELVPAAGDYVAYDDIVFTAAADTCQLFTDASRLADTIAANPSVQNILQELAHETNWSLPFRDQVEKGGFLVSKDGVITFVPYDQPPGLPPGPCLSGYNPSQPLDLVNGGYHIVAQVHTHPNHARSEVQSGNCYDWDARTQAVVPRPADQFNRLDLPYGPSKVDVDPWRNNDNAPLWPGYVLEPGKLYRFDNPFGAGLQRSEFTTSSCVGT